MKRINLVFLFLFLFLLAVHLPLHAQGDSDDAVFRRFFENAVAFADAYPREKVHLHFDNSSYYVGDTIWFKAYVVLAESNRPSSISKPLYVEMLDQTGHVSLRQIVELNAGEGHGQIVLDKTTLSGYYEIRAYTRWMQAFGEPCCFSRTFPVYQAVTGEDAERNIATYDLNPSMKQRPKAVTKELALQFFPEGGSLIRGITSKVAFKAESRNEGDVSLKGNVRTKGGEVLAEIETLHDGMGVFTYTPGEEPVVAEVAYQGKDYRFDLPEALPAGYVLNVNNSAGAIVCQVSCNADTPAKKIAAFISREGRPYDYWVLPMEPGGQQTFLLKTKDLPGGVYQVSLLDGGGETLCERFTFVHPNEQLSVRLQGVKKVYRPFEPVRCEMELTDSKGNPLQGTASVSVRDALRSDYSEYDNCLFTDMLLTSGLKGYIHQPGYYFADITHRKLQELDALLMVHGWRQYDMSRLTSAHPAELLQQPETDLILSGQIRSSILKNELADMEVSIMAKVGDTFVAGQTVTNKEGHFQLPVNGFEGEVEAVFQTRRKGAKRKKETSVLLDRNFSPAIRAYGYEEEHPQWVDKNEWMELSAREDSLYADSVSRANQTYLLDEVEVVSKRKDNDLTTQVFEKSVDAYYEVPRLVDELRDKGEAVVTIPDLLSRMNPNFTYDPQDGSCRYKEKTICLIVGTQVLDSLAAWVLWNEIDGIKRIMICEGSDSYTNEVLHSARSVSKAPDEFEDVAGLMRPARTFDDSFYIYGDAAKMKMSREADIRKKGEALYNRSTRFGYNINNNIDLSRFGQYALFYITPYKDIDYYRLTEKTMRAARGTRRTFIQGYTRPLAFYSPVYKDKVPVADDRRRTLYWNPSLSIDEKGKATIECYNGSHSGPVLIQVEILENGVPCSVIYADK